MDETRRSTPTTLLSLILGCYALSRVLELVPTPIPRTALVALDVLSAMAFALIDGARHYGWRGILVFAAICAVIGNSIENVGISTGFPFGRYEFLELMGPKLFQVPVLLGLAYIGMAYLSWTLARLIVGRPEALIAGPRVFAMPAVASCIMVAWDWAQDPVWGTILHAWRWRDGGSWFGVPISNFLGWYCTVFLIYLAFALYLHRWPPPVVTAGRSAWWSPVLFYALCAAGNAMQIFAPSAQVTVMDASGKSWRVADILVASGLVSVLVMGGFALIAAMRLVRAPLQIE